LNSPGPILIKKMRSILQLFNLMVFAILDYKVEIETKSYI